MKVAFVYDRVNKIGGAERVLLSLHTLYPDAPLFTSVYSKKHAPWANVFSIKTSFLQAVPFFRDKHEYLPWITPLAFETLNFDEYDVVISVTSAEAKSIVTKPQTLHICYCLTPTRYLWSHKEYYQTHSGFGLLSGIASKIFSMLVGILRQWDLLSSSRPDFYIAISKRVSERIERYYHKKSDAIIYPPVNTDFFRPNEKKTDLSKGYFLCVGRLVSYKRIDLLIEACNTLQAELVIVGEGREQKKLKAMARGTIRFVSRLTDQQLLEYYQKCRAFLFAGDEDFGMAAAEALSVGKPIIAYKNSGLAEIADDTTGIFFGSQTVESIINAMRKFDTIRFDSMLCRKRGELFGVKKFQKSIETYVIQKKATYSL